MNTPNGSPDIPGNPTPSDVGRAMAALGASKGGDARAKSLTPERRREIARCAVESRWERAGKTPALKATHGSADHPLKILDFELPCFVLEDGRRVLHQRGMVHAIGMARGSSGGTGGDRLAKFVGGDRLNAFVSERLREVTSNPIKFITTDGLSAYGYEATVLADICEAVLAARKAGVLQKQQEHIAAQCEILVRGFARVGIIALVDAATGYEDDRPRQALAKILEAFVAKELRPWVHTFPMDYYRELFRLRGKAYPPTGNKMPRYFGILTNDIVYRRLAPGVLNELRRVTPRDGSGRLRHHLHRKLTDDVGHPKLLQHLGSVVTLMRMSNDRDYAGFEKLLDKYYPRQADAPLFEQGREHNQIIDESDGG